MEGCGRLGCRAFRGWYRFPPAEHILATAVEQCLKWMWNFQTKLFATRLKQSDTLVRLRFVFFYQVEYITRLFLIKNHS